VAAVQMQVGQSFEENLEEARKKVTEAAIKGAKVVVLPEYFYLPQMDDQSLETAASVTYDQTFELLMALSHEKQILLAACLIEPDAHLLYNTAFIFKDGELIGKQRKVHLTAKELELGISRGNSFDIIEIDQMKVGVLVCADVLYPEACRVLGILGCDIVFNPVVSFYHNPDITKEARDCIFISRAFDNTYFVIKASGVGKTPWGDKIVGRSLIASPWGVIERYTNENKPEIIVAELDFPLLRRLRDENYSLTDRVKEAYKPLFR